LLGAHLERRALLPRDGVHEAADDGLGAAALDHDLLDRGARDDGAAALHHLGDVVEVRALLALVAAALEALPRAHAVLDVAVHAVALEAEPLIGEEREAVRAAEGRVARARDEELALDAVLRAPDGVGHRGAAHAEFLAPRLEDVARRAHGDRGVHHRGAADEPRLHDGPGRAAHRHERVPVVHHVAHAAVGAVRIVLRIAPRAGLDDGDALAAARERHGRGRS